MQTVLERFIERIRVDPVSHCWLWQGAKGGRDGYVYGVFQRTTAHRWAYRHFVGPIPDGAVMDHVVCDTPLCVNPFHVAPSTQRANLHRSHRTVNSINAAKTHCKNGHAFTPENTYVNPRTKVRACRACRRGWAAEARRR